MIIQRQHIRQIIDRSYGLSSLDANAPAIADPGQGAYEKIGAGLRGVARIA